MTRQLLHEGICRQPGSDLLKTDGLYVVEKILGMQMKGEGGERLVEWLVKWQGYVSRSSISLSDLTNTASHVQLSHGRLHLGTDPKP